MATGKGVLPQWGVWGRRVSQPVSDGSTLPCSSSGDKPSGVQHLQARSSSRVALKPPSFPQRLAKLLDVQSLPAGACWENKPLSFVCSHPLFKAHPMGRAGTAWRAAWPSQEAWCHAGGGIYLISFLSFGNTALVTWRQWLASI